MSLECNFLQNEVEGTCKTSIMKVALFLIFLLGGVLLILAGLAMNNGWFEDTALEPYFLKNLTMQTVDYIIGGIFLLLAIGMVVIKMIKKK